MKLALIKPGINSGLIRMHLSGVLEIQILPVDCMAVPEKQKASGVNRRLLDMVRSRRLELPPRLKDSDLNAARLPIPPRPHEKQMDGKRRLFR